MNDSQATPQSIAHAPFGTSGSFVVRSFRFALTALVVAAACYLAFGFGRLWAERRAATQPVSAAQLEAGDENPLAAAMPLAGLWSFDELDWNLRSDFVDNKDIAARFEALAAQPAEASDRPLPDTDPELIDLIETLQIRPVERAGNQVYLLDRRDLKAELISRLVAGRPKTVALAVAYPQNGETWQLFEFTPRLAAENSSASDQHLVPLPAGARRSGSRHGDGGQLLMEFVSLEASAEELLAAWQDAGWEARPSGLGGPDDFSYLCARGDEVIYVWSANSQGPLKNLMLVRTPSPENTSP